MNHSIDPLCITKYIIKFAIKRFDDKKKISNSIKILRVDCFEKYRLRPPLSLSRVQKFIEGWPIPYATMLSARRLSFIVRRNFLSSNRRNCRQEAGKGRIRRRAVFEKLGYGSTGALTLISAISAHGYECTCYVFLGRPNTAAVHNARQNSILYTHTRARTNLPFPSLQPVHTSAAYLGSSSQLFTLLSRKLLVHDYIFFYPFFILLETPPIYVFLRI